MPRTRAQPKLQRSAPSNGPAGDVLTLSEAAGYLRLPEADVLRLVREQGLPGRHVGHEWRFFLGAIRAWLGASTTAKPNNEAWIEVAGARKDDRYFDDVLPV